MANDLVLYILFFSIFSLVSVPLARHAAAMWPRRLRLSLHFRVAVFSHIPLRIWAIVLGPGVTRCPDAQSAAANPKERHRLLDREGKGILLVEGRRIEFREGKSGHRSGFSHLSSYSQGWIAHFFCTTVDLATGFHFFFYFMATIGTRPKTEKSGCAIFSVVSVRPETHVP